MHTVDTKKPAIKQVFYLIDPFEVREVLQGGFGWFRYRVSSVSIPLKSGRCCKATNQRKYINSSCLNPFEVREVLQVLGWWTSRHHGVSIPLKSGRCCKLLIHLNSKLSCLNPFEVREVLQGTHERTNTVEKRSQSLWSQGGAARFILSLNVKA